MNDKQWTMQELEEHMRVKQIETLTKVLLELRSDQDLSAHQLAQALWDKGIRGVYRI